MKHSNLSAPFLAAAVVLFFLAELSPVYGNTCFAQNNDFDEVVTGIPEISQGDVEIICATELTELQLDPVTGTYIQSTFKVSVQVTNISGSPIFDVEASALFLDNKLRSSSSSPVNLAQRLDSGAPPVSAEWTTTAGPRTQDAQAEVRFLITYRDELGNPVETRECSVWITIPAIKRPVLDCSISTDVTNPTSDTEIEFDLDQGDYEGEASTFGNYSVFTVTANIVNAGEITANGVRTTLLIPQSVTLEQGETAIKSVDPSDIQPGQSGKVSWKLRAIGSCQPKELKFEVLSTAVNAESKKCALSVTLWPMPCALSLNLPDNAVGVTGQTITVPVYFRSNSVYAIERYRLMIGFDPALVRFVDVDAGGTRTDSGWRGPLAELLTRSGAPEPDVVMISGEAIAPLWENAIQLKEEGILVNLRFRVVYNPGTSNNWKPGYVNQAALTFQTDIIAERDRPIKASVNAPSESWTSEIILILENGSVIVAGSCVWPLVTTMSLEGNTPNPFNPSTTIAYELQEGMEVSLRVMDVFGREIRQLETGYRSAGRHEIVFDADNLPSGVYFYQLSTPAGSSIKRMLLLR